MVKLFYIMSEFDGKWAEVRGIFDNKKDAIKRLLHMAIFYLSYNYFDFNRLVELSCDDCNRSLITSLDDVYYYTVNPHTCICVDCIKSTKRKCNNPDYLRTDYEDIIDEASKYSYIEANDLFITIKEYGEIEIKENTYLKLENVKLKALVEHYKYKPPPLGQTEGGGEGYESAKKHFVKESLIKIV